MKGAMRNSRKLATTLVVSTIVVAGVALVLVLLAGGGHPSGVGSSSATISLPSGCTKPSNGYLIIADDEGFNDSKLHGAPTSLWPAINVTEGSTVSIVVCNADTFTHGFQITHYSDSNIESVQPGQVITVSFVASEAGDFRIYCSIFCPVHIFMQSGVLRVMT